MMRQMGLLLLTTDISHMPKGDASISHVVRSLSLLDQDHVTGTYLLALRRNGLKKMNQIGAPCPTTNKFVPHHTLPVCRMDAGNTALQAVIATLSKNTIAARSLLPSPAVLAIPRTERRLIAERYIILRRHTDQTQHHNSANHMGIGWFCAACPLLLCSFVKRS